MIEDPANALIQSTLKTLFYKLDIGEEYLGLVGDIIRSLRPGNLWAVVDKPSS